MSKFLRGPFETIAEVTEAIRTLREEGHEDSSITVVANREEDLHAFQDTTLTKVKQADTDNIDNDNERPFWQQVNNAFTGYFLSQDYKDSYNHSDGRLEEEDDANQMIAGFRDELEDGKILLLVEDITDQDAKFNLDAVDDINRRTDTDTVHPDVDENEANVQENTTHVPNETDVTPIFDDPTDAGPRDVPAPGEEDQ